MSRTKRFSFASRVAAVSAVVVLSLGVGGCGKTSGNPGAAAIVGDNQISETLVTDAINDWQEMTGQDVARANMVVVLSQGMAYADAAEELGLDISDETLDSAVDEMLAAEGFDMTAADLSDGGKWILRPSALVMQADQMGVAQDFADLAVAVPVKLNPRYGYEIQPGGQVMPLAPLGDAFVADSL